MTSLIDEELPHNGFTSWESSSIRVSYRSYARYAKTRVFRTRVLILHAEKEGFEPSIPFWGIHTFQACSFDHSDTSPFNIAAKISLKSIILQYIFTKIGRKFFHF